jgi:Flp pilus assembly CpaF family ATPase
MVSEDFGDLVPTPPPGWKARPGWDGSLNAVVRQVREVVAHRLAERARADEEAGRPPMGAEERRAYAQALIAEASDAHATQALAAGGSVLDGDAEALAAQRVFDALFELAGFQPYLEDPEIENIDANGCDNVWIRYTGGRAEQVAPVASSDAELVELICTVAARSGLEERRFDRACPRLSVQLPDGSRLFAVMAVSHRPAVSIRRHRYLRATLDQLVRMGTIDVALQGFCRALVRARKNVIIGGGTNIGKTTFLRALAAEIPPAERLITVEDAYELWLHQDALAHPNMVAFHAREANIEGEGEVSQAEQVRWGLRMGPDRVIVGEVRGEEVVPMLNAMSQGNDGSMCTVHASSSRGVFTKLATYAIQSPERLPVEATATLVASAVHFVVHLAWARDGRRVVSSVREVVDAEGAQVSSNEVWRPGPDRRALPGAPVRAETMDELVAAGLDPALLDRLDGWWSG